MAGVAPLDPVDVTTAVRTLLLKETERIDDPHPIPEDRGGWHAMNPITDNAAGAPHYEPEAWRWFDLVDVGYVDEIVLITFRWTDPATPELHYSYLAHADRLPDANSAATVVRSQLRRLLEPGWRNRVEKQWLSRDKVLVWRPRDHGPLSVEDANRRAQLHRHINEVAWTTPRPTSEGCDPTAVSSACNRDGRLLR